MLWPALLSERRLQNVLLRAAVLCPAQLQRILSAELFSVLEILQPMVSIAAVGGMAAATPAVAMPKWIEDAQPVVAADHNRVTLDETFRILSQAIAIQRREIHGPSTMV
jgi:hypothetical protein